MTASSLGRATTHALTIPAVPAIPLTVPTPREMLMLRATAALDTHGGSAMLRDRVGLADFAEPSRHARFHIVDLVSGQSQSYLCAHGRGSDPAHSGWLETFSNVPDSLASSAGAYRTGDLYEGKYGLSMRLTGLEARNSNAEARAIVVHGAPYVSEDHIATWGKIGRSEGCFAFAPHMVHQVLALLGPGRLIYADKLV